MKKIVNKFNNLNFTKYSFSISYIILSLISILYVTQVLHRFNKTTLLIMILFLIVLEVLLFFVLKKLIKNKIEIHKLYLVIVIFFGVLYLFGFPPSALPDDQNDYLRSLEVSEFHPTSINNETIVGREYSKNIWKTYNSKTYKDYYNNRKLKLDNDKAFMNFANKSLYAFVCYIPQAIGIFIGRIIDLPIVFQALLGKLCNFIMFVILTFLSIKYIPSKKNLLFLIFLLPITLQIATSLSPDCMIISMSIALISFILWSKSTKKEFSIKHYTALSILLICLSLCKIVYLPLCFLILLIPKECYGTSKRKILFSTIILLICIIFNLIWLKISSDYLDVFTAGRGSDSTKQLAFILSHPFNYIMVILNTINYNLYDYITQMLGNKLGNIAIDTAPIFVVIIFVLLISLIGKDKSKEYLLNNIEKVFAYIILFGVIILTFTALYLQWTPVYLDVIEGIQGRYFLPLIPLLAMVFMPIESKNDKLNSTVVNVMILFNIIAVISVYSYFV